jgi:hypothetical protein
MGAIPVPTPVIPQSFPYTFKYTFSHTDFQTAGLASAVVLFKTSPLGRIHSVDLRPTVAFTGSGAFTSYQIAIGVATDTERLIAGFDVTTISGDPFTGTSGLWVPSMTETTTIIVTATAAGALLNTSTAGSVDIWITISQLPA